MNPHPPFPTRFKQAPCTHLLVITPPLSRALGRSLRPPTPQFPPKCRCLGGIPEPCVGLGGANAIGSRFVPAQHQLQLPHSAPCGDPQP